jgi:glucokinase
MYAIGIDLGGTTIKAGVVNDKGEILLKGSRPTGVERGHEATIRDMAGLSLELMEKAGLPLSDIDSVGIGIPGVINNDGVVPFLTNLFWHDVPLVERMRSYIDKPVFVANDATVAGFAEHVIGVSAGTRSSVFVTLGTGLGGGVVLDGKPFVGAHGVGTEIGHVMLVLGGVLCTCGNRGCWERYASATALIRMGRERMAAEPEGMIAREAKGASENVTAKLVMDCAKAGDPGATAVFDEYVYYLAAGIANMINVYDPEVIALGGGVSAAGAFLLDAVRKKLPELVFYKTMPYARVELATLGNDAGMIGAAMLAMRAEKP